tara:strand:+ start:43 stop:429 length:387 start_codon:yes stop_codon:yes gene_type:complete
MNKYTILEDVDLKKDTIKDTIKDKPKNNFKKENNKNDNQADNKIKKIEECPICFDDLNQKSTILFTCGHKFHLKCLNEWKLKKEEQGYVYICELCQVPRDVEHIELTEEDKRKKLGLFKRCFLSCFGL